ncbi:uncharacterized protein LOC130726917 [Lotus japonicus]|uniref:uncharacterized protein LOC130726917 n=1 Tax=Lotus japonicus TaxID=34305 RepID=UPI00258354AE|nr:uncharacterized protein LOC130726917 [Lotus japonicus]
MATMWKIMETHHEQQSKIAMLLRHVDSFQSPVEATRHKHNHDKTRKLLVVLREWLSQFDILMNNQKKCIMALNNQLEMRDEISESLPIQVLLQAWHCRLEKLPQQYVRTTIANFAAEIDSILQEQDKEMVLKRKCEVTIYEYAEKISRQLTEWEKKYEERLEVLGPNMVDHPHELVREIQLMKIKLVAAKEDYGRQCLHVTQKSLSSLQTHLPKLFKAMSDFSLKSSMMYNELADL